LVKQFQTQPEFGRFNLKVFDANRIKEVSYTRADDESLSLPIGDFEATQVIRQRSGSNRHTLTWFAKLQSGASTMYLPVKIEQYKHGELNLRLIAKDFQIVD